MLNSIQAETYSETYQRFKMKFLAKIVNSSRSVFRTESRKRFSAVHYLHKKLHRRCSTPFWIRLWNYELFWQKTSSRYASDKNCEKPVWELFLELLQLRLRNNFYKKCEKNSTEKWFSSQLFSASFLRNPEAAIRGVL